MQFAINKEGKRIYAEEASKSEEYYCPICGNRLILKDGSINVTHFAHQANECEDKWNYDMSEWHKKMQEMFPEEQREVVVRHDGEVHRADILSGKYVIEFQHSPISYSEILERNEFWTNAGYKIAWVFDVQDAVDREDIYSVNNRNSDYMYRWRNPKRCLKAFPIPTEYNNEIVLWLHSRPYNEFDNFQRIIWTGKDDFGDPNFKSFIESENSIPEEPTVKDFFMTKDLRKQEAIKNISFPYKLKYIKKKGEIRENYICPLKPKEFGIKCYGQDGCIHCKHCGLITNDKSEGYKKIYCYYPNVVQDELEDHKMGGIDYYCTVEEL